jgi:hypothetical protein
MKFQAGDEVYFIWNSNKFSGTILQYLKTTIDNIYLVQFPPNSSAGSSTNPREIAEYNLQKNTEIENKEYKEVKRIHIII